MIRGQVVHKIIRKKPQSLLWQACGQVTTSPPTAARVADYVSAAVGLGEHILDEKTFQFIQASKQQLRVRVPQDVNAWRVVASAIGDAHQIMAETAAATRRKQVARHGGGARIHLEARAPLVPPCPYPSWVPPRAPRPYPSWGPVGPPREAYHTRLCPMYIL